MDVDCIPVFIGKIGVPEGKAVAQVALRFCQPPSFQNVVDCIFPSPDSLKIPLRFEIDVKHGAVGDEDRGRNPKVEVVIEAKAVELMSSLSAHTEGLHPPQTH
jgi:hypothetical protein